jgi:hypothetical protein
MRGCFQKESGIVRKKEETQALSWPLYDTQEGNCSYELGKKRTFEDPVGK